jgi:hypothetical protein
MLQHLFQLSNNHSQHNETKLYKNNPTELCLRSGRLRFKSSRKVFNE